MQIKVIFILFGFLKHIQYLCCMEKTFVKAGNRVVKAESLYTQTEYHKKTKMAKSSIKYKLLAGTLPTVKVNGVELIILED